MVGTLIFSLIFLAALAVCVYFAWKGRWKKSLGFAAVGAVSFVGAYFLAKAVSAKIAPPLAEALKEGFLEILSLRSDVMLREEAMLRTSALAVTAIVSMALFLVIFLMLFLIGGVLTHLVFSAAQKNSAAKSPEKPLPWLSLVFALISFGTVSFAILYPLGAASSVAAASAKNCGYDLSASILTNPISRLYGISGRGFFDRLTEISGAELKNSEEAELGTNIYIAAKKVAEGKDDDGTSIEKIAESLRSSYILTDFTSELVANAANSWKNGREFMHRKIKLPEGRNGELVSDVLEILSGWQRENLISDIDTLINLYKLLKSREIDKITDGDELFEAMTEPEFVESLFIELSGNDDFIAIIPRVMRFGIGTAIDSMDMEMNDDYIVEFDASELSPEDWSNEAAAFSTLLRRMKEMSEREEGDFDVGALLTDIYQLSDSKLLSNMLLNLLIQVLYNTQLGGLFG